MISMDMYKEEKFNEDKVYIAPDGKDLEKSDVINFFKEAVEEAEEYDNSEKDLVIGIPEELEVIDGEPIEDIYEDAMEGLEGQAREYHNKARGLGRGVDNIEEYLLGAVVGGGAGALIGNTAGEGMGYVVTGLATVAGVGAGTLITREVKKRFENNMHEKRKEKFQLEGIPIEKGFEKIQR